MKSTIENVSYGFSSFIRKTLLLWLVLIVVFVIIFFIKAEIQWSNIYMIGIILFSIAAGGLVASRIRKKIESVVIVVVISIILSSFAMALSMCLLGGLIGEKNVTVIEKVYPTQYIVEEGEKNTENHTNTIVETQIVRDTVIVDSNTAQKVNSLESEIDNLVAQINSSNSANTTSIKEALNNALTERMQLLEMNNISDSNIKTLADNDKEMGSVIDKLFSLFDEIKLAVDEIRISISNIITKNDEQDSRIADLERQLGIANQKITGIENEPKDVVVTQPSDDSNTETITKPEQQPADTIETEQQPADTTETEQQPADTTVTESPASSNETPVSDNSNEQVSNEVIE